MTMTEPKTDRLNRRCDHALRTLHRLGLPQIAAALDNPRTISRLTQHTPVATQGQLTNLISEGRAVLEQVSRDGSLAEPPSAASIVGLEAIVVAVGRPALLIRNGSFENAVDPWTMLEQRRAVIEGVLPSVGRIELTGHPSLDWVGTGFLITPEVVLTNRHVVQEFATRSWTGRWTIDAAISARIDFAEEIDAVTPRDTPITEVIAVHPVLDLALLSCKALAGHGGLQLDAGRVPVAPQRPSYIVGYPALDSRRNDSATLERVFGNIFNVKRLQPGLLTGWLAPDHAYTHDCSTLGGNSGSCLVDLDLGIVVGIHFGGRFGQANWAVSTRDLADEPILLKLGAKFV
jgi:hypothetical protein